MNIFRKTSALLALVALSACTGAWAQLSFGAKVSGSANGMFLAYDTNRYLQHNPVLGYNIGLMVEYRFRENMSVGTEVMFAQQGFSRNWMSKFDHQAICSQNERMTCRTYHLNIPLLYRFYYNKFALVAGPQVSLCFGGTAHYYRDQENQVARTAFDTVYIFSKWEYENAEANGWDDFNAWNRMTIGATAGICYHFENNIFIGFRYTYDFTDALHRVFVEDLKWYHEQFKSHHSVLSFSVGIKI